MGSGQIRKGKTALVFDVINTNIGGQGSNSLIVGDRFEHIPDTTLTGSINNHAVATIATLGASGTSVPRGTPASTSCWAAG